MAKEQLHSWGRFVLLGVFIVFATGGWVVKVLSNTEAITRVESKVEVIRDDVVDLKLQYKDIEGLTESIFGSLGRLEIGQTEFRKEMRDDQKEQRMAQKIISDKVIMIQSKVEQLTKDED